MVGIKTGIITRLNLVKFFFLANGYSRTSLMSLIKHFLSPRCESIAKKFTNQIREEDDFIVYRVNGYEREFFYPKEVSYHNFAQVISEGMDKKHWHHYDVAGTRVEKGEVIVDCGSAEGFFAFQNCDIARKVYCIEPSPTFHRSLEKMFGEHPNVEIVRAACGDKNETLYFNEKDITSEMVSSEEEVGDGMTATPCYTLDELFLNKEEKITYIKADLEGFEERMLAGALKVIAKHKPKIAITTYHGPNEFQEMIRMVTSVAPEYKYKTKGIEANHGKPVMLHMWVD